MKLREVKMLAAGIVIVSLATTNFIVPAILEDTSTLRVTAISKPEPIAPAAVPEPVRVLTTAEAQARAAAMRAHADRALAENGELPGHSENAAPTDAATVLSGGFKCVAGCN
jgi:hypothetical protein